MTTRDTPSRILDAAEGLIAETGVAGTSLRAITSAAGVNLAAAHYHFHSKDALALAVFTRRLRPLNEERLCQLAALEESFAPAAPPLEEVLAVLAGPVLRQMRDRRRGGHHLVSLMARLYHSESWDLKQAILAEFATFRERFLAALRRCLPELPEEELAWRVHFSVGAMLFTVGGGRILEELTRGRCTLADAAATQDRLVAFLAAGFRTPVNTAPAERAPTP